MWSKLVVSVVNPRFHNFTRPIFLAVLVGACTLGLTLAIFFVEWTKTTCTSLNYNTPLPSTVHSEHQYVSGYNGQVEFVWLLRYGGSYGACTWEGNEQGLETTCGVAGTIESSGMTSEFHQVPGSFKTYFETHTYTETLIDKTDPNHDTEVVVTTTRRDEYAVCLSGSMAFIVADVTRTDPVESSPGVWTAATRPIDPAGGVVHVHPQVGGWPCNPPEEFYEMKYNDMGGVSYHDDPDHIGHTAEWFYWEAGAYDKWGGLPICPTYLSDGVISGATQPPNIAPAGVETTEYPFYNEPDNEDFEPEMYTCKVRSPTGGRQYPVMNTYRSMKKSNYTLDWEPRQICVRTPLVVALGTAFAYATYLEMVVTLLILGVLIPAGVVKTINKVSLGEVAKGQWDDETVFKRITALEKQLNAAAADKEKQQQMA